MTLALFLVDTLPPGDTALLDGPEGRHAATVRRLRPGEELLLSDGAGGMAHCAVTDTTKDSLSLTVIRRWHEPEPTPRVVVAQALAKGDRGELAVELATEAGVDAVIPWRAARCVTKWDDGPRGAKALQKWRATAREAAKQARRPHVPTVTDPMDTKALTEVARASALTLVLESAHPTRLADIPLPADGDILLVIGPEGGITPDEIATLEAAGATTTRLGPTVLRTSTAAAVALGAIGTRTQRWR